MAAAVPAASVPVQVSVVIRQVQPAAGGPVSPVPRSPGGAVSRTATPYAVWAEAPLAAVTTARYGPPAVPVPLPAVSVTALYPKLQRAALSQARATIAVPGASAPPSPAQPAGLRLLTCPVAPLKAHCWLVSPPSHCPSNPANRLSPVPASRQ